MNRFILMVPFCPEELERQIHAYLIKKAGWWHVGRDVWALKFSYDVPLNEFRDEIMGLFPGLQFMLVTVSENDTWGGFGATEWGKWFTEVWDKDRDAFSPPHPPTWLRK